jgi:SAM-dependent methyltransferase
MPPSLAASYEELPYTNNSYAASHPRTMATVAWLHGLEPPDLTNCRVLELGCGRGGNLLPMAESAPGSQFVGIDLSPRQIDEANADRETLGLKNIDFHALDILNVDDEIGTFDYVLGHGVYSWVSPQVQEAIFRLCAARLTPNGIAYLSYNTFPGWHYNGVMRDLLCYHVTDEASPHEQMEQVRSLIEWFDRDIPDKENPRSQLTLEACKMLGEQSDAYIYHEYLEIDNRPCYFHEFAETAVTHGLQYIAEAFVDPRLAHVPATAQKAAEVSAKKSRIRYEQYLDFIMHRAFRCTLLCREGAKVLTQPQTDRLKSCYFKGIAEPTSEPVDSGPSDPLTFGTTDGISFTTEHPLVKTMLLTLLEMGPLAVPLGELSRETAARMGYDSDENLQPMLLDILKTSYHRGVVRVFHSPPVFVPHVSERPVASPVARLQACGDSRVTNREHWGKGLGPFDRFLLTLMDGTRNREELIDALCEGIERQQIDFKPDRNTFTGEQELRDSLNSSYDELTGFLAQSALLIA